MRPIVDLTADPSDCDATRAILSAYAARGLSWSVPTSTLAIQHELWRRNMDLSAADTLHLLSEMFDAQHLGHGFWLPAPAYQVPADGFSLLVSGLPTQEIRRHFGVQAAANGASRVLLGDSIETRLPSRPFEQWLGAPPSTVAWLITRIAAAKFSEPFGMEGVEIYRHWPARSPGRWMPFQGSAYPSDTTALGRHHTSDGRSSYYLLRIASSALIGVSELPPHSTDVLRLMYGLQARFGDASRCYIEITDGSDFARVRTGPLPNPETRLLRALGRLALASTSRQTEATIPLYSLVAVKQVLTRLGLAVETVTR